MRPAKRLLKSAAVQQLLAWIAVIYFLLIKHTTRWTVEMPPATATIIHGKGAYIGCFWHGRMALTAPALPKGRHFHMLVSGHRDGALIGRGLKFFGASTISGSSRRGGAEALRQMQRILDRSEAVGITPDGPRGPRMRAKPGAIKIAQLSGVPIIMVGLAVRRRRLMNSWDRFLAPWPFSSGLILWGEPIEVPRRIDDAEQETYRLLLEERLNALTAEADRRCGLTPVEPEPNPTAQKDETGLVTAENNARA